MGGACAKINSQNHFGTAQHFYNFYTYLTFRNQGGIFLSLVIGYDNNTIPYLTVTPTPMVMLFLQKIKFQKNNPIACYSIWNQGSLRKLSLIISLLLSGTGFWMNSRIVLVVNFVESLPQIEWRKVVRSTRYHCLLSKS